MSLIGFDTLRRNHPDSKKAIADLESAIAAILAADSNAVIDDNQIAQMSHLDLEAVQNLTIELVAESALNTRLFWKCPNGFGTSYEADRIEDFPDDIECDRCGDAHQLNCNDIEVLFLPSDALKKSVPPYFQSR